MFDEAIVELKETSDIVRARSVGRDRAAAMRFGRADQTRLATAISELARNVIRYAGTGICMIASEENDKTRVVRVCVEDNGPGIPDIEEAMNPGFSTGGGLGAGLAGTKRLTDEFEITSRPGLTRVTIAMVRLK